MSVNVAGTVVAPAAVRTHTEPPSPYSGGTIHSGSTLVTLNPFKNTGNVAQTLTLNDVSVVTGCTISDFHITHDGVTNDGHSLSLTPGQEVSVVVNVSEPTEAPGTPDAPFSFTLDTNWA